MSNDINNADNVFSTIDAIDASEPTPVVVIKRNRGPRGSVAKTAPRHAKVRELILNAVQAGPVTAMDIVALGAKYSDVLAMARREMAAGTIVETKKGRKATWTLPGQEE